MHQRRAYNFEETYEDHMHDSAYGGAYDTALENDDRNLRMLDENTQTFQSRHW